MRMHEITSRIDAVAQRYDYLVRWGAQNLPGSSFTRRTSKNTVRYFPSQQLSRASWYTEQAANGLANIKIRNVVVQRRMLDFFNVQSPRIGPSASQSIRIVSALYVFHEAALIGAKACALAAILTLAGKKSQGVQILERHAFEAFLFCWVAEMSSALGLSIVLLPYALAL